MNKTLLALLLGTVTLTSAEVSVFGAGNLDSPNPYGLTNTEKHLLKTKKEIGTIDSKVKNVKSEIETISERIDGLESIYEGDSQKVNSAILTMNKLLTDFESNQNLTDKNSEDIKKLKELVDQLVKSQQEIDSQNKKNLENLKEALSKITSEVNKINKSYLSEKDFKKNMDQFVTKDEFEALKKSLNINTSSKNKSSSSEKSDINKKLSADDKANMLNEAIELFKKDYFTKAIPMFEDLISQNYKPAESNFYLGQIWYYRKKYELAISYYKKSAMLYDKAEWMPTLLFHSAVSFEKLGDFKNSANFYETLITNYPDSTEAKKADKNLTK